MTPIKTLPAKHISISIARSPKDVYGFASDPANLPEWASGLSGSTITQKDDVWLADSPMGAVQVRFAPHNEFGVIDHDVTLPDGKTVIHNPLRVLRNHEGSEVIFTLFRQPDVSDKNFQHDFDMVTKDLAKLKSILEKKMG